MDLFGAISLIALLVSIVSLFWSFSYSNRALRSSLLGQTEAAYIPIEHLLADAPGALKFHGIDPDDLQAHGVTAPEFAYLLSNFTAGGIFDRTHDIKKFDTYALDSYTGTMLRSPHTRRAWPLLKQCMNPSPYREKIEATIRLIEEAEGSGAL